MEDKNDLVFTPISGESSIVPSASFEDTEKCIVEDTNITDLEEIEYVNSVIVVPTIDKMEVYIKVDEKLDSEDDD